MGKNSTALSTTIASWTRKLSFSLLLLVGACAANPAQEAKPDGNRAILRAYTEDQKVSLRVRVNDSGGHAIPGLSEQDFQITLDDSKPIRKFRLNPDPPPTYIVMLLDLSGSMNNLASPTSTQTKLEAAKVALDQVFAKIDNQRTKIAIVPFAKGGEDDNCKGFPVTPEKLQKFTSANEANTELKQIGTDRKEICGSTDLYSPIAEAIQFLVQASNQSEEKSFRLSPNSAAAVILLSDGYQSEPEEQEKKDFDQLKPLLGRAKEHDISVHTLGYGFTPEQLARRYSLLGKPVITRSDLCQEEKGKANKCLGKPKESEFVDRDRLAEIATTTGGIHDFAADPKAVANKIDAFIETILGAYELQFQQPDAEPGAKHKAIVNIKLPDGSTIPSNSDPYAFQTLGRPVPGIFRLVLLGITLVAFLGLGVVPFFRWAAYLQQQAEER